MSHTLNITPVADRLLIKRLGGEEKSAGGIIIPDSAKEKPQEGQVMAVGTGKTLDNGTLRKMTVKVNDKVLFSKYSGNEVKLSGEEYLLIREDDVLAILN